MVAGCFDLLHPSHLVFLKKAAQLGDLHVSLGSDQSIQLQKNKRPNFSEDERSFMLASLKCVTWVGIVTDPGPCGFEEHIRQIQPELFVINDDGDTPEKRRVVESHGVEYRVFPRDHFNPLLPTSTSDISHGSYIPSRVSLCSGFLDNPAVNAQTGTGAASLVVIPVEPIPNLQERSGMATSTINTARKYFGCMLPKCYSPEQLGEMIFCLENPPHKRGYVSGTLDSLGILGRGINLFTYDSGSFFPRERQSICDESILQWVESHVYLKHAGTRPHGCRIAVNPGHPQFSYHCRALHDAALQCWDAIQREDLDGLASAMNQSRRAQASIVPNHSPPELTEFISAEAVPGAMIMGAGGGGYVAFAGESIPQDAIRISVRREDF